MTKRLPQELHIVRGRGLGQWRRVTKTWIENGVEMFEIEPSWDTVPDESSWLVIITPPEIEE